MTTVHMSLLRPAVEGRVPSDRLVEWRPVTRVIDHADDVVVERAKFTAETVDGELTVTVAPGFWMVRTDVLEAVLVPDVATVEFADMQRVDPDTLIAEGDPPIAAWTAALEAAVAQITGETGASAYEAAVAAGYVGSEEEWAAGLASDRMAAIAAADRAESAENRARGMVMSSVRASYDPTADDEILTLSIPTGMLDPGDSLILLLPVEV